MTPEGPSAGKPGKEGYRGAEGSYDENPILKGNAVLGGCVVVCHRQRMVGTQT